MTPQPPAVQMQQVSFAYGPGGAALQDVDLQIASCDLVSVVGPNGGGKTTLLKLLLGLLTPQAGVVRVLGVPPRAARPRVGYVPQHAHADPQFPVTVTDVVLTGRLGRRRRWGPFGRVDRAAAREALELVGLGDTVARPISSLSGGQRQRVLIARALAGEPELLLLDEPASNLDVAVESELFAHLERLSRRLTVIIVSHDLGFVSQYVRTVVCVNRRVQVHPVHEVTGRVISEVYGSEVHIVRHDHPHTPHGFAPGEPRPPAEGGDPPDKPGGRPSGEGDAP